LVGCSTIDKALFNKTETPVLDTSTGKQATDAEGNPIVEVSYTNTGLSNAAVKVGESLPGVFGYIGTALGAALAGVCEYRRKKYVKKADGTLVALEEQNETLTAALNAVAKARDQIWDKLDQIEGGQAVIDWFDNFAKNNTVNAGAKVAEFLLDTLKKAETPDKAVANLTPTTLEAAAKAAATA